MCFLRRFSLRKRLPQSPEEFNSTIGRKSTKVTHETHPASTRGPTDPTRDHGDAHPHLHFGINFFSGADNLKLVSGVGYDDISPAKSIEVFQVWNATTTPLLLFF